MSCKQKRQLVRFPKVRILKQWFRHFNDHIAWIDFILEQHPERFVDNEPSARIAGTRARDYAPRALPELFKWENEGQTVVD